MRWEDRGPSNDVEDRRGQAGGGSSGGGLPVGRLGIGGTIFLLVLSLIFKRNFFASTDVARSSPPPSTQGRPGPENGTGTGTGTNTGNAPGGDTSARFASFVLDDIQNSWARYPNLGAPYERTKLVLFTDRTTSRCGDADAATEVKQLDSNVVATVAAKAYGRYDMQLANGSVWQSVDPLPYPPKAGTAITIKAAPLGAYRASIAGGRSILVKRIR